MIMLIAQKQWDVNYDGGETDFPLYVNKAKAIFKSDNFKIYIKRLHEIAGVIVIDN